MINNDNLGNKRVTLSWWILVTISGNESSFYLIGLDFNIESNVVSWLSNLNFLVMHLDGFDLSF